MNIAEAQAARIKLEKDIAAMLADFSKETGDRVTDLRIDALVCSNTSHYYDYMLVVDADVRL